MLQPNKPLDNFKKRGAHNMAQGRIRWGILGTSPISKTICRSIAESKTGTVAAVGSRNLEKALKLAEEITVSPAQITVLATDDYTEIVADKTIDAIYIGLPNALHADWIMKALAAGKHVLCEKPFVISIPQMLQVMIAAKTHPHLFCMEALMYRCHPLIKKLMSVVHEENKIGRIEKYTACYAANIRNIANPAEGGSIRNLGCYPVSLVRLLARALPTSIKGKGTCDRNQGNDNHAEVILNFADGAVASIVVDDDREMEWKFEIEGTAGKIEFRDNPWKPNDGVPNTFILTTKDGQQPISVLEPRPLYALEIDNLGEAVWNKKFSAAANISLQDSMDNVYVLESWRQQVLNKNFGMTIGGFIATRGQFGTANRPTTTANDTSDYDQQHTVTLKK
jgi:predicted dehydrogenase